MATAKALDLVLGALGQEVFLQRSPTTDDTELRIGVMGGSEGVEPPARDQAVIVDLGEKLGPRVCPQPARGLPQSHVLTAVVVAVDSRVGTERAQRLDGFLVRSEEHTSELQSRGHLVCRLLLEKKNIS